MTLIISMNIKQHLYNQCLEFIDSRLQTVQHTIKDIQKSLTSETKSSAGDKHETGRAMLQLEREKAGNQLAEITQVKETLSRITTEDTLNVIRLGSLVYTSGANYYIAISAGEIKINSTTFYAISPATPIAKELLGKQKGDQISFRSSIFAITEVI